MSRNKIAPVDAAKAAASAPYDDDHINDVINDSSPLVRMAFDFFVRPESSIYAHYWALFISWVVVLRVFLIALETFDGPNQYAKRAIVVPRFPFLLNDDQYWTAYITVMAPLILDALGRVVMLVVTIFDSENDTVLQLLAADVSGWFLLLGDIVSVLPFLANAIFIRPTETSLGDFSRLLLRLLELMGSSRIFRFVKDIPAIWAIKITLARSMRHLVVPIFFFVAFNMTGGLILYFLEPCYNTSICPWRNLVDSTFYSIVSMTTTGYGSWAWGTQVPLYLVGRFIGCIIMIFGSLFLSMPLAILGNKYQDGWDQVTETLRLKAEEKEYTHMLQRAKLVNNRADRSKEQRVSLIDTGPVIDLLTIDEEIMGRLTQEERKLVGTSPIMKSLKELSTSLRKIDALMTNAEHHKVTHLLPMMIFHLCMIRGQLKQVLFNMKAELNLLRPIDRDGYRGRTTLMGRLSYRSSQTAEQHRDALVQKRGNVRSLLAVVGASANAATTAAVGGGAVAAEIQMAAIAMSSASSSTKVEEKHVKDVYKRVKAAVREHKSIKPGDLDLSGDTAMSTNNTPNTGSKPRRQSVSAILFDSVRSLATLQSAKRQIIAGFGFSQEDIGFKSDNTEFAVMMARAAKNPLALRSRIWKLLEAPHSSRQARALQLVLLSLIVMSIFVFYTETLISLTRYGENVPICGLVVQSYCVDKTSPKLDPGCFVYGLNGPTRIPLQFNCNGPRCFGEASNFGALNPNLTCANSDSPPFQTPSQLQLSYGAPYFFTLRPYIHSIQPICNRLECRNSAQTNNGNAFWIPAEVVINFAFTVEAILRAISSSSLLGYWLDRNNVMDLLSIAPFYAELLDASLNRGGLLAIDFSILSSSPTKLYLVVMRSFKIFRMFKLMRHFRAAKELGITAARAWKQLMAMISLLILLVVIFAIMLYQVEVGSPCFVGDSNCVSSATSGVREGGKIFINKVGSVSQFSNMFHSLWFSIVTLTTTGYGDIVPVTDAGKIIAIFLMLAGTLYMAMPLTAAASTFYEVHQEYNLSEKTKKVVTVNEFDGALQMKLLNLQIALTNGEYEIRRFVEKLEDSQTQSSNQKKKKKANQAANDSSSDSDTESDDSYDLDDDNANKDPTEASRLTMRCREIVALLKVMLPANVTNLHQLAIHSTLQQKRLIQEAVDLGDLPSDV